MPPKRKPENSKLPARWAFKHGAYYYLPPKEVKDQWDGKSWFRLGDTLPEAYKVWANKINSPKRVATIGSLLDRYSLEVIPTKAPKTQTEQVKYIASLRIAFNDVALNDIEPQHIYQYVDKRKAKTSARREIEVLSHAYTKAVQWGLIGAHPFKGEVRLEGLKPRSHYVEDWELQEALSMPATGKTGGTAMIQAYLRVKMLTGLRQRDLLLLTLSDIKPDGIHVTPSKTKHTTGKTMIYEWTPELRAAIDAAKETRPALSAYLFCDREGMCFVNEETGEAKPWNRLWQKFIGRVLQRTKVTRRFTEHDLRAKVGSDAESLERARELLGHAADSKVTSRVYRRKPERIKPVGG